MTSGAVAAAAEPVAACVVPNGTVVRVRGGETGTVPNGTAVRVRGRETGTVPNGTAVRVRGTLISDIKVSGAPDGNKSRMFWHETAAVAAAVAGFLARGAVFAVVGQVAVGVVAVPAAATSQRPEGVTVNTTFACGAVAPTSKPLAA